ncbi:MAG: hypothetical protein V1682_01530 [Candidatus Omnitrophota bacterium]
MNKYIAALSAVLIVSLNLFAAYPQSQKEGDLDDGKVPPGMVRKTVGGMTVVVPIDSWIKKKGDALILEDINAYVARKTMDMEKRIAKIEADLEDVRKELKESKGPVQGNNGQQPVLHSK